jgi:hypothetical protein
MDTAIIRLDTHDAFEDELADKSELSEVKVHNYDDNMLMVHGARGVAMLVDDRCQVQQENRTLTFGKEGKNTDGASIVQAH